MVKKQQKSHDRAVGYTVMGVVAVVALLSLLFLFGTSFRSVGKVSLATQFLPGQVVQTEGCKIPTTMTDLVVWRSRRKNFPLVSESCPFVAQKFCVTENSGHCLQECLRVQQSSEGVCQGLGFPITGEIVLNFEECRRLAESFAQTSKDVLLRVGAVPQTTSLHDPCTDQEAQARRSVYSLSDPVQAYAHHEFSTGDSIGLYANEQKNVEGLEYVLCADGRARVTMSGEERCSTLH